MVRLESAHGRLRRTGFRQFRRFGGLGFLTESVAACGGAKTQHDLVSSSVGTSMKAYWPCFPTCLRGFLVSPCWAPGRRSGRLSRYERALWHRSPSETPRGSRRQRRQVGRTCPCSTSHPPDFVLRPMGTIIFIASKSKRLRENGSGLWPRRRRACDAVGHTDAGRCVAPLLVQLREFDVDGDELVEVPGHGLVAFAPTEALVVAVRVVLGVDEEAAASGGRDRYQAE